MGAHTIDMTFSRPMSKEGDGVLDTKLHQFIKHAQVAPKIHRGKRSLTARRLETGYVAIEMVIYKDLATVQSTFQKIKAMSFSSSLKTELKLAYDLADRDAGEVESVAVSEVTRETFGGDSESAESRRWMAVGSASTDPTWGWEQLDDSATVSQTAEQYYGGDGCVDLYTAASPPWAQFVSCEAEKEWCDLPDMMANCAFTCGMCGPGASDDGDLNEEFAYYKNDGPPPCVQDCTGFPSLTGTAHSDAAWCNWAANLAPAASCLSDCSEDDKYQIELFVHDCSTEGAGAGTAAVENAHAQDQLVAQANAIASSNAAPGEIVPTVTAGSVSGASATATSSSDGTSTPVAPEPTGPGDTGYGSGAEALAAATASGDYAAGAGQFQGAPFCVQRCLASYAAAHAASLEVGKAVSGHGSCTVYTNYIFQPGTTGCYAGCPPQAQERIKIKCLRSGCSKTQCSVTGYELAQADLHGEGCNLFAHAIANEECRGKQTICENSINEAKGDRAKLGHAFCNIDSTCRSFTECLEDANSKHVHKCSRSMGLLSNGLQTLKDTSDVICSGATKETEGIKHALQCAGGASDAEKCNNFQYFVEHKLTYR
jgi:hypothetical protein